MMTRKWENAMTQGLYGFSRMYFRFCHIILLVITGVLVVAVSAHAVYTPPSSLTVNLHRLNYPGGADTGIACTSSPSDLNWGCTWFDVEHFPSEARSYPYNINPVTIPIETDYLLDVLPQEMGPYYNPIALQAQALAARTYAYWHKENGYSTVNNSTTYQVFIPYKFESLPSASFPDNASDPCASTNLNANQQIICTAVAPRRYISYTGDQPAFTEFGADALNETVSNPTDRVNQPSPYLLGVDDPISAVCDADNGGHGHGLSQEGASRWARGNQCSHSGAGDQPWSVAWSQVEQILVHYYTGIHVRVENANLLTPEYRWNPLRVTWSGSCPPMKTKSQNCTVTVQVQNTGVADWTCGQYTDYVLSYRWVKLGYADLDSANQVSLCGTGKGDPSPTVALTINDIPDWGNGVYILRLEMARIVAGSRVWFSTLGDWPTYDTAICASGTCQISLPQISR